MNSLRRTAPASSPAPGHFDAGASSSQTITQGDGYVEFTATETNTARVLGLASGTPPPHDPADLDADVAFGVRPAAGGFVLISENGRLVLPPNEPDPINPTFHFAPYASGDRLRVEVSDLHDGTAEITYSLIPGMCPAAGCVPIPLRTTGPAPYPFRVKAALREQGATLTDVRIARIK